MTDEGKNELAEELVGAIRRDGPMTFAAFMSRPSTTRATASIPVAAVPGGPTGTS